MNCHVATAPCSSEKLTEAIVVPAINTLKNITNRQMVLDSLLYSGALCTSLAQRYPTQSGKTTAFMTVITINHRL
jgi:hypothetical protein